MLERVEKVVCWARAEKGRRLPGEIVLLFVDCFLDAVQNSERHMTLQPFSKFFVSRILFTLLFFDFFLQ